MTERERRVLAQDYPKDWLSDDEWDFIEAMASATGDGVKNKSITAGRMPRSGGVRNMAKQNNVQFSIQEKCDYYSKRVNNPNLSERQRKHAAKRLNELCGGNEKRNNNSNQSKYTDAQKQAFHAGAAYGLAKTGRKMNVSPENQQSFKNGVKAGRAGKYAKK